MEKQESEGESGGMGVEERMQLMEGGQLRHSSAVRMRSGSVLPACLPLC